MAALEAVAKALEGTPADADAVAGRLAERLGAVRKELRIDTLQAYDGCIEMRFTSGAWWAIECLGGDAFHFYPGVSGDGDVTWLNVWVAPDLSGDELMVRLREVVEAK
jgi:hypothetical protein